MSDEAEVETTMLEEDLSGIPEKFVPVARKHGRALWALVFNSNIAQSALQQVAAQATKHQSRALAMAGVALGNVLRDMSSAYAGRCGWTQEQVDECARDCMLAMQEQPSIMLLN